MVASDVSMIQVWKGKASVLLPSSCSLVPGRGISPGRPKEEFPFLRLTSTKSICYSVNVTSGGATSFNGGYKVLHKEGRIMKARCSSLPQSHFNSETETKTQTGYLGE